MIRPTLRTLALTAGMLLAPALALGAAPKAAPKAAPFPMPKLPGRPLHSTIIVEVNKHGQVVRVNGGTLSKDSIFDTMTIGNALQMWIRHPDGSSVAGLFRVTYDYDPHLNRVSRHVALISVGGAWANQKGAATQMIATSKRETQEAYARLRAQQAHARAQSAKHLPDIHAAVKRALASPTPHP